MNNKTKSIIIAALTALYLLFCGGAVWSALVEANTRTHAVSPAESPHIEVLTGLYPQVRLAEHVATALSTIIVLVAVAATLRSQAPAKKRALHSTAFLLYSGFIAAVLWWGILWTIPAGVLLLAIGAKDENRASILRKHATATSAVDFRRFVRFMLKFSLIFGLGGVVLLLAEALLHTSRFAAGMFAADFPIYLAYAATLGALGGIFLSFFGWIIGLYFYLFSPKANQPSKSNGRTTSILLPLGCTAVTIGLVFYWMLWGVFGREISDLHVEVHVGIMSFLLGYLLLLANRANYCALLARAAPDGGLRASDCAAYLAAAMLLLPLTPLMIALRLWGRGKIPARVFYAAAAVSATILAIAIGGQNWPMLTEFSYVGRGIYSVFFGAIVLLAVFVLTQAIGLRASPKLRVSVPLLSILMASALAGCYLLHADQQTRLIANEYSSLGRTAYEIPRQLFNKDIFDNKAIDAEGGGLEFFGARHSTLPELKNMRFDSPPPVIFILIDAARADRTSLHGYSTHRTTPFLEEFAKDAFVFNNARSAATATTCSMRSIFSGRYSSRALNEPELSDPFCTTAMIEDGYEKFFINHFYADRNGVAPERFYEKLPGGNNGRFALIKKYDEKDKVEETVALIKTRETEIATGDAGTGYCVYMHFNATHFPWKHPHGDNLYEGYEIFGERQQDLYDEAMLYTDITLRNFFDDLKAMGVYDKAVIIVTADHGSGLDDHGHFGGFYCYEEQLHVPLMIKLPASAGLKARRIDTPVSGLDIAPTIVNLMRRSKPNPYHGVSLLPLMTGEDKTIDRDYLFGISSFHDSYSVVGIENNMWRWKYIVHRDRGYEQLYDLLADPHERNNLIKSAPEELAKLREAMQRFLAAGEGTWGTRRYYH